MIENIYTLEVQNKIEEIERYRGIDRKRVMGACDYLENFGRQTNDEKLIGYARFSRGEAYYMANEVKKFYDQMREALRPLEHSQSWDYVARANNLLGIMSLNGGNAPYAMDYYNRAIAVCQEHKLPDLEWMIHMNVGSLYNNIEEYFEGLVHYEQGYKFLLTLPRDEMFFASVTAAYLGMGKAWLKLENVNQAQQISVRLLNDCLDHLNDNDKLNVYCYEARLNDILGKVDIRDHYINLINENITKTISVMDSFDDFYDYLLMLLDLEMYDDFFIVYEIMDEITKKTLVKNLEIKLLTLKIRYFRRTGQTEAYKISSVLYFELTECMERENRLMINSMISMKTSLHELSEKNRKYEIENESLQKKSETDALTGLANRFKFNEYSEKAFKNAMMKNQYLAIEILDIDYFKQYNDNYGHQAGDECIKLIGQKLHEMQKEKGIFCCRYGGDEFIIIYEGLTQEETLKKARELKESIVNAALEHKYSSAADVVTISQGIYWDIPDRSQTASDFLHAADNLLYEVKKISRNSIKIGSRQ